MNNKVYLLPALFAASSMAFAAGSVEERLSALENEIRIAKAQDAAKESQAIQVNGFFSFGMSQADNDLGYAGATDEYSFDELTILGIQANASLGDGRSVTTQMLAKGDVDNFDPKISWAYLSQTFDNGSTARVGKLRVPLFMYSDFLDVGLAQPWIRPVEEVYGNITFDTYLGGDYVYDFELEDSTLSLQTFAGYSSSETDSANGGGTVAYDDLYGLSLAWTNDTLTLRSTYGTAKITSTGNSQGLGSLLSNTDGDFFGLGLSYDDGSLLFVSEITRTEAEGNYPDVDSTYFTLGYRIDKWTPYVSLATFETQDDDNRAGISSLATLNAKRKVTSIGTRYSVAPNVALKADISKIDGFGDTVGMLFNSTGLEESTVYSVRVDTVF